MAAGIVKEINSTNRSYYMVNDITELLGNKPVKSV